MPILSSIFGTGENQVSDPVIANDMLAGAKAGAAGYLAASLESATPEIRRLFSQYSAQMAQGHEAVTAIAVKNGWYKPYAAPTQQLQDTYELSQSVLTPANQ